MLMAVNSRDENVQLPCSKILGDEYDTCVEEDIVIDLINVFSAAYIADISTFPPENRDLKICVPVCADNILTWNSCKEDVVRLLNFVTEADNDTWRVEFYPVKYQRQPRLKGDLGASALDNVSLLSGGLDSFCGIYENELGGKTPLYCGYKTSNIDASHILKVFRFAHKVNPRSHLYEFERVAESKRVYTQRTRSLLFLSLACFSAAAQKVKTINVYENGTMSLNPSFESRGTTRTTHPKTIHLYQELVRHLGLDVIIVHPFLFRTKGELVSSLPPLYRNMIKDTRSCSRSLQDVRYRATGVSSCGACVPCLLRKISLAAYDMEDYDHEYYVPYQGNFNDDEYNSAYSYFERFARAIANGTIFANLDIRREYYSDPDYCSKTERLLTHFHQELLIFFGKYGR